MCQPWPTRQSTDSNSSTPFKSSSRSVALTHRLLIYYYCIERQVIVIYQLTFMFNLCQWAIDANVNRLSDVMFIISNTCVDSTLLISCQCHAHIRVQQRWAFWSDSYNFISWTKPLARASSLWRWMTQNILVWTTTDYDSVIWNASKELIFNSNTHTCVYYYDVGWVNVDATIDHLWHMATV